MWFFHHLSFLAVSDEGGSKTINGKRAPAGRQRQRGLIWAPCSYCQKGSGWERKCTSQPVPRVAWGFSDCRLLLSCSAGRWCRWGAGRWGSAWSWQRAPAGSSWPAGSPRSGTLGGWPTWSCAGRAPWRWLRSWLVGKPRRGGGFGLTAGLCEEDEVTSDPPGSLLGATEQMLRVEHRGRYDSNLLLVLAT